MLILLASPLMVKVASELYDKYGVMSPSQAVVILGLMGGSAQLAVQGVGSATLETMDRQVNVLELVPAVAASTGAVIVIAYTLLPPNPNPVSALLSNQGSLPS